MTRSIDFYFDFISPFSYLAQKKLPGIASRFGYGVTYRPMDIPAAKMAAGNYGPSNREVPAKIKVMTEDLQRWAEHYGVPLQFPKSFDCVKWNAGALFAELEKRAEPYITDAFHRIWGEGIDPADRDQLADTARRAGLDERAFLEFVESPRGMSEFRKACVEAHRRGVFGAPIMMLDEQTWWGNDRLMFLEQYLHRTAEQASRSAVQM